jgi:dihydrofolate reductase
MESKRPRINMVAAIGKNRVIGKGNQLLWTIPEDLKRFKQLTTSHPVIMGRKTFDSIAAMLGKPLPNRTNIVITRDTAWGYDGVVVAHSLDEALAKAGELDQEVFVIGGAQIYEQALPYTDRLFLTLIDDEKEGDAYFPAYEHLFTKVLNEESHEHKGLKYIWKDLEK